jgi:predicted alpha/beta-hydrolase family hydrolase
MLFVQGSRDAFGTPDELRPVLAGLEPPPELFIVDGGDHSFAVLKRSGRSPADVRGEVEAEITRWVRAVASIG